MLKWIVCKLAEHLHAITTPLHALCIAKPQVLQGLAHCLPVAYKAAAPLGCKIKHTCAKKPLRTQWLCCAVWGISFTAFLLGLPLLKGPVAFAATTSIACAGLVLSYAMPILLRVVFARRMDEVGPFSLGRCEGVASAMVVICLMARRCGSALCNIQGLNFGTWHALVHRGAVESCTVVCRYSTLQVCCSLCTIVTCGLHTHQV